MRTVSPLLVTLVATIALACSTTFTPQPCAVDGDCGDGRVCELVDEAPACVAAEDAPIVIGQSAPFTGGNQALGVGMRQGIALALAEANAAGGVRGRPIRLVFKDDGYDPLQAEANARALVDARPGPPAPACPSTATPVSNGAVPPALVPVSTTGLVRGDDAVLALVGSVGTPTMVRAAPVAIETGTVYFGAFTGAASLLRDDSAGPCKRFVFNVRASYAQEAHATVEYFLNRGLTDYRRLISFDQNDTFGNAGYTGLVAAWLDERGAFPAGADPTTPIARFRYARNDVDSVPAQAAAAEAYLTELLTAAPTGALRVGVMLTATYGPAATFIEHLRRWQFDGQDAALGKATRLELIFSAVSFVGPDALAAALVDAGTVGTPGGPRPFTQGVAVSQVVPNYQSDLGDGVAAYQAAVAAAGEAPGFTSLEGYLATRVFVAGLMHHQGPFTPTGLIDAFETLPDLGLGLGANAGFARDRHQYLQSVWGTTISADGRFANLYYWTVGSPIQFFQ